MFTVHSQRSTMTIKYLLLGSPLVIQIFSAKNEHNSHNIESAVLNVDQAININLLIGNLNIFYLFLFIAIAF